MIYGDILRNNWERVR